MGWDSFEISNYNETPTCLDDKQVGLQEFEVEEDIIFTAKYKVLAKDKSDLIDKKIYLGGVNIKIKDDNEDNIYDLSVKNWGTENLKENETGKKVVKDEDDFITIEQKVKNMTITEMEKEIIKAIRVESQIPLASDVGYKNLIKFVKKLFKEYRNE